jgi:MFS family permease
MRDVVEIARTMGPEQLFLALVFLASYSLALGEFATARGRRWAVLAGLAAASAFSALSHPWEGGIVLVACALVGMALFSAPVWALSLATTERAPRAAAQASEANLPRARAVSSSRSVKNAPILNSPAAE